MNPSTPYAPSGPGESHPFVVQLLVGFLLIAAVAVALWILADPAAALLTLTAAGAAGLLVVGVVETAEPDGENRN